MKKERKLKLVHLLRILFTVIILTAAVVTIFISIFTLKRITDDEINREKALLENSVNLWDRNIRNDLNFMYDFMTSNVNLARINMAENDTDMFYALQDIQFDLKQYTGTRYGMEEIFFYTGAAGKTGFVSSYVKNNDSSVTIKEKDLAFIDLCESDDSAGNWMIRELYGENYLVFILKRGSNYLGCWSRVDYLLEDFVYGKNDPQANHVIFITDTDGVSRTDSYLNGEQLDLDAEQGRNQETKEKYRQIIQRSGAVPIYFTEHIKQSAIESAISYMRSILIIIGIVLVAIVALWIGIMDNMLYRPIKNLVTHMSLLSEGDLDTRITETSRLQETSLLYDTFNNMADEIRNLKISVYENELLLQKTDLEYMQIQIHPHFLVNGINSVSAMIDMSRYDAAKEMCAYLAEYYRYQFQQTAGMIPLRDEIKQVELYMNIQMMRHPGRMDCHCEMDEECAAVLIPPLSILSFAGNCFKYGMNHTTLRTDILIRAEKTADGTRIEIRDKGPGFTDEVLQSVEQRVPIYQKGRECIGLRNAMTRLYLFYDGKASCRAYNDEGAVVEIVIPDQW